MLAYSFITFRYVRGKALAVELAGFRLVNLTFVADRGRLYEY